ncbi:hypothetical protein AB0O01_03990 [Streptomyces sp. NPDC093252]|uniref:hypothetical protein n=1 Tax=Streptomyces sp. NPDC093252 TaxID=3154980 RepID=UPI0034338E6D
MRPGPHDYWAEITAEGPVYGGDRTGRAVIGRYGSAFVRLVLGWTVMGALRIADGLDPDPGVPWCAPRTLVRVAGAVAAAGDVPTVLRRWSRSEGDQCAALRQLMGGDPWALIVSDDISGLYSLTVWPVTAREVPPVPPGNARGRHRKRHVPGRDPCDPMACPP